MEQVGFATPDVIFKILNIYATSFYGSNLWNFSSQGSTRLFNSWNTMIRNVWGLSNIAHKYLMEHVSSSKHIRTIVYQRFLTFIQSLMRSKKKCLSALVNFVVNDPGSTTCQNLNIISKESGLTNILEKNPNFVKNSIMYAPIPAEDSWKVDLLDELLLLRSGDLELEGNEGLKFDELQALLKWVSYA